MSFHSVSSVLALVGTVYATLVMLPLRMASGAIASDEQIRMIKGIMIGFSLLSVAGIIAGIMLLRTGHHGWSLGASAAPSAIMGVALLIAFLK